MKLDDLATALTRFGVDPSSFDLEAGLKDEAYCLTNEPDGWHRFFMERGRRTAERVFDTEWEASDDLIRTIAADPQTRSQARLPPSTGSRS